MAKSFLTNDFRRKTRIYNVHRPTHTGVILQIMISCRESSKLLCRDVLAVEWKELKKATEITKLDHVRNITHWTGGPYSSGLRVLAYNTSD